MKTLRKVGAVAICVFMAVSMSACGDDDDDNGDDTASGEVTEIGGTHLTGIDNCSMKYDGQGRLVEVGLYGYEEVIKIDYSKGKMTINEDGDINEYNVKFNGKGYLTEITGDFSYEDEYESSKGSGSYKISYDGDQIKAINMSSSTTFKDKESGQSGKATTKGTLTYKWSNGNLISYDYSFSESYPGESFTGIGKCTYAYSTTVNTFRQYTYNMSSQVTNGYFFFAMAGLYGKGSAYLPSSSTYHFEWSDDEEDEDGTETYTFGLNTNGSIEWEQEGSYNRDYYIYTDISRAEHFINGGTNVMLPSRLFMPMHRK